MYNDAYDSCHLKGFLVEIREAPRRISPMWTTAVKVLYQTLMDVRMVQNPWQMDVTAVYLAAG